MMVWFFLLDDAFSGSRTATPQAEAFEALYERYHPPILRYLTQMCGSADQAEELAQETFVKAYVGMLRFRGEASKATWLYRIARNTYLNTLRRPAHARLDAPTAHEVADHAPERDPVRWAADREASALIALALAQLPEQHRSILLLRDAEGLAYVEIADVLGLSVAAVRMKLFRARNLFRRCYNDLQGDTNDEV